MGLVEKIAKLILPFAAAGLIGCSSVTKRTENPCLSDVVTAQEKAPDRLKFGFGASFRFPIMDTGLDRAPRALRTEADNPYMMFNGERIDTKTYPHPHIHAYSIPSLKVLSQPHVYSIEGDIYIEAEYKGLFIQPMFTFLPNIEAGMDSYVECQAPQPWNPFSYYDIRYVINYETRPFPVALRVGCEFLKAGSFTSAISLAYSRILSYKIFQGIESYGKYNKERTLASGNGNLYSLSLNLNYLISGKSCDGDIFLGLESTFDFGDINFKHDTHSKFGRISVGFKMGFIF